jgi:hypothetical protein
MCANGKRKWRTQMLDADAWVSPQRLSRLFNDDARLVLRKAIGSSASFTSRLCIRVPFLAPLDVGDVFPVVVAFGINGEECPYGFRQG